MKEPVWVTPAQAIALQQSQIREHGGSPGIRDRGLLESALARPGNVFAYDRQSASLPRPAAAYAYGIVRKHPFIDGNERAGFVIAGAFLDRNGVDLTASEVDVYDTFIKLAAGEMDEQEVTEWFAANTTVQHQRTGTRRRRKKS